MDTNGHEWISMNHETHEIHEKKKQNHEWTRMDTNGHECLRLLAAPSFARW